MARPTRRDLIDTAAAIVGAVVVAVVARLLLGAGHTILLAALAYVAFVAILLRGSTRRRAEHAAAEVPLDFADLPPAIDLRTPSGAVVDTSELALGAGALTATTARDEVLEPGLSRAQAAELAAAGQSSSLTDGPWWLGEEPLVPGSAPPGEVDLPWDPAWDDPANDVPIKAKAMTDRDWAEVVLAAGAAITIASLLRVLLGWDGILGTVVWAYLAFLGCYFALLRDRISGQTATDRIVTTLVWSGAGTVVAVLGWMIIYLVAKGLPKLDLAFFTQDLSETGPLNPGGGAKHAIIGTIQQVGIATIVVVPIAILTAVYLHEIRGRMAKTIRFIVDAMSGLPSIVAGLLIFTVWVNGRGFSGIAASMALVVLMLPTVTRTAEEILRTIPDSLREASLALGAPQWRVVLQVVLPTARAGLVTAVILGVARAIGETAPMLLTALGTDRTVWNPIGQPQSDLPLFVWKLIRVPNAVQVQRAWTGALVLVMLVLALFVLARFVANRGQKKLGRLR